jgi:hypothetical protein
MYNICLSGFQTAQGCSVHSVRIPPVQFAQQLNTAIHCKQWTETSVDLKSLEQQQLHDSMLRLPMNAVDLRVLNLPALHASPTLAQEPVLPPQRHVKSNCKMHARGVQHACTGKQKWPGTSDSHPQPHSIAPVTSLLQVGTCNQQAEVPSASVPRTSQLCSQYPLPRAPPRFRPLQRTGSLQACHCADHGECTSLQLLQLFQVQTGYAHSRKQNACATMYVEPAALKIDERVICACCTTSLATPKQNWAVSGPVVNQPFSCVCRIYIQRYKLRCAAARGAGPVWAVRWQCRACPSTPPQPWCPSTTPT